MASIGYWRFNGNTNDYSGYARNGTPFNAPTYNQSYGKINGGVYMGVTSQYMSLPQPDVLGLGVRTYSFWFKSTFTGTDNPCIFDNTVYSATNDRCSARVLGGGLGEVSGRLRVWVRGQASEAIYRDSVDYVNDGVLRYIVIKIDVANATIEIYINGKLNQNTQTGSVLHTVDTTGAVVLNSVYATNSFADTYLDEFNIDNRLWSPAEIKNKYAFYMGLF